MEGSLAEKGGNSLSVIDSHCPDGETLNFYIVLINGYNLGVSSNRYIRSYVRHIWDLIKY
jgi:hypothetical protein